MNTILEWIQALPLEQPIIDRIIEETTNDKGEEYLLQEHSEHEIIKYLDFCTLFIWRNTKEGFDYWCDINNKIPLSYGH